jgi:two-component system LytT family response regulator
MYDQIKTIIIDDEPSNIQLLKSLLNENFPFIHVIGTAANVADGIALTDRLQPDLLFLDVNLPDGDGMDLIRSVKFRSFEVIFVTAHNGQALRAFAFSAFDCLLKPIDYDELHKALLRYRNVKFRNTTSLRLEVLDDNLHKNCTKLIVPGSNMLEVVPIDTICYLQAIDTSTHFRLSGSKNVVAVKPLHFYTSLLDAASFAKAHSNCLINLKYVKRFGRINRNVILLKNGEEIEVAAHFKNSFRQALKDFSTS